MKTRIVLLFTVIDWETGAYSTVSHGEDEWEPLQADLNDEQPMDVARGLFSEAVDLHPNWASIKIIDALVIKGTLHLVYCVEAPMESTWKLPLVEVTGIAPETLFYDQLVTAIRTKG